MKQKTIALVLAMALLLGLTGCSEKLQKYNALLPQEDGAARIDAAQVGEQAVFFNYEGDAATVQLLALRDEEGTLHAAFNTCQNCSPSPRAFYQQQGDVLVCQNCHFTFTPQEVGITAGGCNPWPIQSLEQDGDRLVIAEAELREMQAVFANWAGPVR